MIDVGRIWRSSAGAKAVMAVSGMILFGFTVVHMLGNLNVFLGREAMNDYGAFLHEVPDLLLVTRVVLLTALVAHVVTNIKLMQDSAKARPQAYKVVTPKGSTLYSRTMRISGPIVLTFIVLHLLNLTFHPVGKNWLHPDFRLQAGGHAPDAFHNLTTLLSQPLWGIFYVLANLGLGLHLFHGAFAMFRSLGVSGDRQLGSARMAATGLAVAVSGGNVLLALAILVGLVK